MSRQPYSTEKTPSYVEPATPGWGHSLQCRIPASVPRWSSSPSPSLSNKIIAALNIAPSVTTPASYASHLGPPLSKRPLPKSSDSQAASQTKPIKMALEHSLAHRTNAPLLDRIAQPSRPPSRLLRSLLHIILSSSS
jgi:hypothetical protein